MSLWSRGTNKWKWIKKSRAWRNNDRDFRARMTISKSGWFFKVCIPTLLLVAIPPAAGAIVADITPPPGLGCRSLSFIVYAICQFNLALIAVAQNAVDDEDSWLKHLLSGKRLWVVSGSWWFGSLLAVVGGTTMQITGVCRNCICYAGAENWVNIYAKNPLIQIAADTQDKRDSSSYWLWVGSIAMIFMALNCYVGWRYQKLIRHHFANVVMALEPDLHKAPVTRRRGSTSDTAHLLSPENNGFDPASIRLASGFITAGAFATPIHDSMSRYSISRDPSPISLPRMSEYDDIGAAGPSTEGIALRSFQISRRPVSGSSGG